MDYPVLTSLLGKDGLQKAITSWPNNCFDTHGPVSRLPEMFREGVLTSISTLASVYRGMLMESGGELGNAMATVPGDSVSAVIGRKATAYLHDIGSLIDGSDIFMNGLKEELGMVGGGIRLGAFISAAGSGASTHYDAQDVISVQLIGEKNFYLAPVTEVENPYGIQYSPGGPLFDDLYPQMQNGFPQPEHQTFRKVRMRPGSALFMPRGTWHRTLADQDSMAVSIVLDPATELDCLLSLLKSTLLQDSGWRKPRYGLNGVDGINKKLYSALSNTTHKLLKSQQNPQSSVRSFQKDSRFVRNPDVIVEIVEKQPYFEVILRRASFDDQERVIRLKACKDTAKVFHWFNQKDGFFTVRQCVKQFPELPMDFFADLFQEATMSGLLQHLWFEPL